MDKNIFRDFRWAKKVFGRFRWVGKIIAYTQNLHVQLYSVENPGMDINTGIFTVSQPGVYQVFKASAYPQVLPLLSQEIANAIKLLPLINSSESHQITFTGFFRSKNGHMVGSKKKLVESNM